MEGLVLALLDASAAIPDRALAVKLRDLTISWSRFKYSGPILEGADLDALLRRAADGPWRWCLAQAWGHVLQEVWTPDGGADFLAAVERWVGSEEFLAAGCARPAGADPGGDPAARLSLAPAARRRADRPEDLDPTARLGLQPGCLLVDLARYRRLGRPALASFPREAMRAFPVPIAAATAWLLPQGSSLSPRPPAPGVADRLRSWLGEGIADLDPAAAEALLGKRAARFLASIKTLVANLKRSVFVWNVEPYDDLAEPPPGFAPPLGTLYSVAAGLKPNRMLEALGFDERTRVVYFDYSEAGLEFRRLLLAEWDGADYPSFLRRLFRLLPASRAHYLLWEGATPETLDWEAVERRWQEELDRWGGAAALRAHWSRYRRLAHEFIHCDLLTGAKPLLAALRDEPAAAIWWSNAFFSVYSNWHLEAAKRRSRYARWIEALAKASPRLYLYGASSDNVSVNAVQAADYRDWYRQHGGDELTPGHLHRVEIRF
jgi:hypothetical protein